MNFHILTLFPEMIEQGLNTSITGRAISNGLLSIEAINIRDYAFNKHQSVDDYPYGGGAGMLMQAEPVYLAYEAVRKKIAERKPAEAETEEPAEAEQLEEKTGDWIRRRAGEREKAQGRLSFSTGRCVQPGNGGGTCKGRRPGAFMRTLRRN